MFPNAFEYQSPTSLDEAVALLVEHGYEAKILAGGQSLLPMMKLRVAAPTVLVDLGRVPGLDARTENDRELSLGAMTRHASLEWDEDLWARYPLLRETAAWIADPLVRNRGTMAGSLAHADPAADWGAALLALHGSVTVDGPNGSRRVGADDFFVDVFTTRLEPDEVLTAVHIPRPEHDVFATHLKLERKVGDFAVVAVSLQVEINGDGRICRPGIGLAGVGPTSLHATAAASLLEGQLLSLELIREAAAKASAATDPASDRRGSADFKRDMVRLFVERGLRSIESRFDEGRRRSA